MGIKTLVISILILFTSTQLWNNRNYSNNLRAIKVSRLFPVVGNDGKLKVYEPHDIEIYYFRDQVLYRTPYTYYTTLANGEIVKKDKRTNYIVYTKGNIYGYFTDSSISAFDKKVLVDSVLNNQWYFSDFLSSIFIKFNVNLVSSNKSLNNLEETYTFKGKADSGQSGSIFLSYTDKLKDIDFSWNKELDSIKNMKLFKVKIVNNSRYLKDYNITVDRVEQNREIEEIQIANRTEILALFEKDKKNNLGH